MRPESLSKELGSISQITGRPKRAHQKQGILRALGSKQGTWSGYRVWGSLGGQEEREAGDGGGNSTASQARTDEIPNHSPERGRDTAGVTPEV